MVTVQRMHHSPGVEAMVQAVLEAAPTYSLLVSGQLPQPGCANSIFEALPPGKSIEDKFVLGIYLHGVCIGVADLIRGYPNAETAMLGLLLISELHQRRGVGRAAYAQIQVLVRSWLYIRRVRIGVVESNARVLSFWQKLGFNQTGDVKSYSNGSVTSKALILEQVLQGAA